MDYRVHDIVEIIEKLAPPSLAFEWDNIGLLLGNPQSDVEKILVCLTITPETVEMAVVNGVDIIIAHHPLIFRPLKTIRTDQPHSSMVATLLKHNIAVYACHTNLDQAPGGLNQWLAEDLALDDVEMLLHTDGGGLGRIGSIKSQTLRNLARSVEELWDIKARVIGDLERVCVKVAVSGGSGGDLILEAIRAGADCLITGDVSYHDALDALDNGLSLIDAGHHGTEQIMVPRVAAYLKDRLHTSVDVLEDTGRDPFKIVF